MRARLKRRERNRRLILVAMVVTVAAVVVVGAFALSSLQSPNEKLVGRPVSPAVYDRIYAAAQSYYGNSNTSLLSQLKNYNGQPFMAGTKPVIVYIGADYCPYCAFQRWALVYSLMRFGNFTGLQYMLSSSSDVFPSTPTFTFYQSSYSSDYISFQGYEQQDRAQNPLQQAPANYTSVFQNFGSSYPFLDIGNRYVVSGAFEFPTLLEGKNWTQIASLLGTSNPLANEVADSAAVITAAICKLTGGAPSSVCGAAGVAGLTANLAAYVPPRGASSTAGAVASGPYTWTGAQYWQTAWATESPARTRSAAA